MLLTKFKSAALAMLPALAFAAAVPAEARDGYYHDRRGGDDAAIAIGAGVVGLALGAAIASSDRDRDYYYDDGYYYPRARHYPRYYYGRPYPRYRGHPAYDYPRGYWRGPRYGRGWGHPRRHWRY